MTWSFLIHNSDHSTPFKKMPTINTFVVTFFFFSTCEDFNVASLGDAIFANIEYTTWRHLSSSCALRVLFLIPPPPGQFCSSRHYNVSAKHLHNQPHLILDHNWNISNKLTVKKNISKCFMYHNLINNPGNTTGYEAGRTMNERINWMNTNHLIDFSLYLLKKYMDIFLIGKMCRTVFVCFSSHIEIVI